MTENNEYFVWLEKGDRIRISVRGIIFDTRRERILVEKNVEIDSPFFNFIGGGLGVGETMVECIRRELSEETNAEISEAKYLFVVEHFIHYRGEVRHSLEHYFEVLLDRSDVVATNSGLLYKWIPIDELRQVNLRPSIVRNCIIDGSYRQVGHLLSTNDGG
jgi:8-oxo-dGTP pyrophosphatase MutT (NUDIX family)